MAEPFLGEIRTFAFDFAPKGWAKCEGQLLPINQNQALFALLGTIYGGDGRVTFALPDLRGRVAISASADPRAGRDRRRGDARADPRRAPRAQPPRQGERVERQLEQPDRERVGREPERLPRERHREHGRQRDRERRLNQPHNTMQPYLALNTCIALTGDVPGAVVTGPSELGSAFAGEAVAAVKRGELRATDPQLAAALGAGWYLAALCHGAGANRTAAAVRGSAMGFASFESGQATAFSRDQVKASAAKLAEPVKRAGLALPALDDLAPENAPQADNDMLGALSAADFRLGKAYGVGAALLQLTSRPSDEPTLKEHLTNANVAPLVAAIDDLGSTLPPHAGHSVRESIREWQKSIDTGSRVAPEVARDVAAARAPGRAVAGDAGRREDRARHARDRRLRRRRRAARQAAARARPAARREGAGAHGARHRAVRARRLPARRDRRRGRDHRRRRVDHRQPRPDLARDRPLARRPRGDARAAAVGRRARHRDHPVDHAARAREGPRRRPRAARGSSSSSGRRRASRRSGPRGGRARRRRR